MNYKATDPIEGAYQALRAALDAGDPEAVQGTLQQLVTAVQSPPVKATAKLGDHQKPLTKAARGFDTLMDGVSQHLRRTGGNRL